MSKDVFECLQRGGQGFLRSLALGRLTHERGTSLNVGDGEDDGDQQGQGRGDNGQGGRSRITPPPPRPALSKRGRTHRDRSILQKSGEVSGQSGGRLVAVLR